MSLESLWTVEFTSVENGEARNFGAGVVVFETNRIFGGDTQFYYLGKYQTDHGNLECQVSVKNYTDESFSIFGELTEFNIVVNGKVEFPKMVLTGHLVEDPSKQIVLVCLKREELPNPS